MNTRKLGFGLFVLFMLLVRTATAGVDVYQQYLGEPAPGLQAIRLSLMGTEGFKVGAVVSLSLTNVHQVWQNAIAGSTQQTPGENDVANSAFGNANWSPLDTHLLVDWRPGGDPVNTSPGFNIIETNSMLNSFGLTEDFLKPAAPFDTYPGTAGLGSLIFTGAEPTLAWRRPQPAMVDLAYVVVPDGLLGTLNMRLLNSSAEKFIDINNMHVGVFIDGPVVDVSGNGTGILNGDTTPSLLDNTDFGTVVAGSVQQRTFTLEVTGVGPLTLQTPVISGPFFLVSDWPTSIDGANVDFTVALDTNAGLGEHLGSLSFAHDGLNTSPYSFLLHAQIVPEPGSALLIVLATVGALLPRRW